MVVIGDCDIDGNNISKYGLRYYRNCGGSVGGNLTITKCTSTGIQSRDGSKVVCAGASLTITYCNITAVASAVNCIKDGYVELRDSTIDNCSYGIFCDTNSIYDNQTGTVVFTNCGTNKVMVGYSSDRSLIDSSAKQHMWLKPSSVPTGIAPSSNYDVIIDKAAATGIQFLTNANNVNIDFDNSSRITHSASDSTLRFVANASEYRMSSTGYYPSTDNNRVLGQSFARWSTVYAGTGTINTSDITTKTFYEVEEAEILCAKELKGMMRKFRFNDAIDSKGEDNARIHFGVGAQYVRDVFNKCDLDPFKYALLCYDSWEDEFDDEGNKIVEAGERYGIRYDELLCFIISAL